MGCTVCVCMDQGGMDHGGNWLHSHLELEQRAGSGEEGERRGDYCEMSCR